MHLKTVCGKNNAEKFLNVLLIVVISDYVTLWFSFGAFKCQLASMKEEIGLCRPKLAIFTTVFERTKGLYNVQCILNVAGAAF